LFQRRRLVETLVDAALISGAFAVAFVLRIPNPSPAQSYVFEISLPMILAARFAAFIPLGLYRGVWRVAVGLIASFYGLRGLPGSVYAIDAVFAMGLIGGSRFAERALFRAMTTLKD